MGEPAGRDRRARGVAGQLAPPLDVALLGELVLRRGGQPLPGIESARARSLIAYLLLHDGAIPRQRLAFVLWPDSEEAQARTNLRHVLHTIRRASPHLERYLEVGQQTLRWRRELDCRVDVDVFEAALSRAERPAEGEEGALAALREAIACYSGELLSACKHELLAHPRQRLKHQYIAALGRVAELLALRGEHAAAIRYGRQLLRGDPLHEATYRLLIAMFDATDDRAGAVRVYHECAATLHRELGIEPSPATRAAYEAAMRAERRVPAGATSLRAPDGARRAPLVGREREWQRLTATWREVERGRAQLVVVTGEAGVGKTRLVEELQAWCAHRGTSVAGARSYETEGELAFGVVTSWLRSDGLRSRLDRATEADIVELARLAPELATTQRDTSGPLDPAEQRRRLFDAIVRVVARHDRPLLLVADDAQWSDAASLQLIHYLVRRSIDRPLLVVATARREDVDDRHALMGLVSGLEIVDRSTEVALERLTRPATHELADRLVGRHLPEAHAAALYAETEGNPLFVVEAIRAGWDAAPDADTPLSPRLHAVIGARLRQLSEPARDVVGIAATVGRAFTAELVGLASDLDDSALVLTLDELWRRGVIREHMTAAYDFAHGRIRDVAYAALSPATRRHHHLRVAEALQRVHDRDLDGVSAQVASHYDRAGAVGDAIEWYRRAAMHARRLDADAEAVRLLERAWALVNDLPEAKRPERELGILTALPTPLAWVDGFASHRLAEAQTRGLEVAATLGVDPDPSLLRSIVMSRLCGDDFDAARAAAHRLRRAAEGGGDGGLLVESGYLLGIAAFWGGHLGTARRHFEHVVESFLPEQRAEHVLRFGHDPKVVCLSRLANTLWFLGFAADARRARDEALTLALEAQHPLSSSTAHVFAALLAVDLDERDRLTEYATVLARRGEQARPNEIKTMALVGLADVFGGDVDAGMGRIRAAIDICGALNPAPGFRAALMRVLLAAHAAADDAEGGLATATTALALGGTRLWEAEARRLLATFLARLGRPVAELDAELRRAAGAARRLGAVEQERRVDRTRAELLVAG